MTKRTDDNQDEIVKTLRQIGASVHSLHTVGSGVPDLLVGFRGQNYLVEVKNGKGKLNDRQREWHSLWRGQVCVIRSVSDVLSLFDAITPEWRFVAKFDD